jgi:IS5 family transposase
MRAATAPVYLRIAKRAAMMAGRYAHAKQFQRDHRQLRLLRTRLGRLICNIGLKIAGQADLETVLERPLARAEQIRSQQQRQRGWKLYSFHAPEVECIGKGKASAPYECGVKASVVTTNARAPGGQFVLHTKVLPGNPYDGHTLSGVIDATEELTGCEIERGYVDKGLRHSLRCRLQPPPRPRLAEDCPEPNPAHSLASVCRPTCAHEGFLTGD